MNHTNSYTPAQPAASSSTPVFASATLPFAAVAASSSDDAKGREILLNTSLSFDDALQQFFAANQSRSGLLPDEEY